MARFYDALGSERCTANVILRDGSGAQCGHKARPGTDRCWQHTDKPTWQVTVVGPKGQVLQRQTFPTLEAADSAARAARSLGHGTSIRYMD